MFPGGGPLIFQMIFRFFLHQPALILKSEMFVDRFKRCAHSARLVTKVIG